MNYIKKEFICAFFHALNHDCQAVRYVLIKNINGELPERLKDGKDIDLLVKEEDHEAFAEFMRTHGFRKTKHPLGRKNGWNFAYQLPESEFWKKQHIDCNFYIDVSFRLCCKSLTPKTWIPLDACINEDVWRHRVWDEKNNWWAMDDETTLLYLIVRSIFDKREFQEGYIRGIEERLACLDYADTQRKLRKVFFRYTPRLTEQIKAKNYSSLIEDYLTFADY
ncbi:MAG: nucleotidyltransferase family protein [Eubacterium sp.]|nr:nucleotidyltransferase family protein [Eubacterium sp.]